MIKLLRAECIFPLLVLLLISACASSQAVQSDPNVRLRNYRRTIVYLSNSSGAMSINTASIGRMGSVQAQSGEAQAIQALQSLQFELMAIGFSFVSTREDADIVGEFAIGSIRYDPIAGWIADGAFLVFKQPDTGESIAMFRAESGFITPTVSSLIKQLAASVKRSY